MADDEQCSPRKVLCPVCSTTGDIRWLDDHTQEELERCEWRYQELRRMQGAAR